MSLEFFATEPALAAVGKQPAAHVRAYYEQLQQAVRVGKQIVPVVQVQPSEHPQKDPQRAIPFSQTQALKVFPNASTASALFTSGQENTLDLVKTHRQNLHDLLMLASTVLVFSPYARWPISEGERAPSTLVTTAIDELERMTESFWRLCANTSLDLLGNLVEHFRTIIQLLKQVQARDAVQRLCSLSGRSRKSWGKLSLTCTNTCWPGPTTPFRSRRLKRPSTTSCGQLGWGA